MDNLNWLDHAIAWFSPTAGLRRQVKRAKLQRGYQAAAKGRRTEGWTSAGLSPNTEIERALKSLRNRSRELVRNNPHAARAVSVWVNAIVGPGIKPRAATGKDALDKQINSAFEAFCENCDSSGRMNYYTLQAAACRGMVESGDSITRKRPRRPTDGLVVPLQLQLLEGDLLDDSKFSTNNTKIIQGVEFNDIDRRDAYWLLDKHPGEYIVGLGSVGESRRVNADDVAHCYEPLRPQQVRGVPWLTPVMLNLRDLDDYEEAELVRKKTESCLAAFVYDPESHDDTIAPAVVDAEGNRIENFSPGLIAYLRGGRDVKFNTPAQSTGYADYRRAHLHTIAAGARLPYDLLTGDLTQVNYSSIRAGRLEHQRLVKSLQQEVFIPFFCAPTWKWFIDAAAGVNVISEINYGVEWSPPEFEPVDPLKEAMSDLLMMRSGTRTLPEAIARKGRNPELVLQEHADTQAQLDALGLIFDSDPRRVNKSGAFQTGDAGGESESDGTDNRALQAIAQVVQSGAFHDQA